MTWKIPHEMLEQEEKIAELKAKIAERDREIDRLKHTIMCAYCGHIVVVDDSSNKLEAIAEHIASCAKNTAPLFRDRLEKAEAELAELQKRLKEGDRAIEAMRQIGDLVYNNSCHVDTSNAVTKIFMAYSESAVVEGRIDVHNDQTGR